MADQLQFCGQCGRQLSSDRCPTCSPPERPAPTTTTASAKTTTTTAPKAAPATTSTKPAGSFPKGKVALAAVLVAIGIGYVMSQQGSANDPALGPTSAASTSEAAGARAPQENPPAVPPPNPANENQTIRSLPRGTWLTVLESLPQTDYTEPQAWDKARELSKPGIAVAVVDSSSIPGLRGGYWAISLPGQPSSEAARAACASLGRELGGSCYDREVK